MRNILSFSLSLLEYPFYAFCSIMSAVGTARLHAKEITSAMLYSFVIIADYFAIRQLFHPGYLLNIGMVVLLLCLIIYIQIIAFTNRSSILNLRFRKINQKKKIVLNIYFIGFILLFLFLTFKSKILISGY